MFVKVSLPEGLVCQNEPARKVCLLSPISNHFSRLFSPLLVYELVEEWSMWAPWGPQLRPWTVEARTVVVVRRSPSLVRQVGRGSTFLGAAFVARAVFMIPLSCALLDIDHTIQYPVPQVSRSQPLATSHKRFLVVRRCALSGVRGSCAVECQMHACHYSVRCLRPSGTHGVTTSREFNPRNPRHKTRRRASN